MMSSKGFTLVELAIALMIIGLLIGGVLKGQELIDNARITRTAKDFTDIKTAVMIFQNTYGGLPGDFKYPNRIPNCNTAPCSTPGGGYKTFPISGSFGYIPNMLRNDLRSSIAFSNFWRHLNAAGMISGIFYEDNTQAYLKAWGKSQIEGMIFFPSTYTGVTSGYGQTLRKPTNFIILDASWQGGATYQPVANGLTGRQAMSLDTKLDDGNPTSGDARAIGYMNGGYQGQFAPTCVEMSNINEYVTSSNVKSCNFAMEL